MISESDYYGYIYSIHSSVKVKIKVGIRRIDPSPLHSISGWL
jgi:hypothetical protein